MKIKIQFDQLVEEGQTLSGSCGTNGPVVTLTADEKITLKSEGKAPEFEDVTIDLDFDFADFGEKLSESINSRVAELSTRFDTEFSGHAERALRQAQAAIDRAVGKMEKEMARAERRAAKVVIRKAPKPPKPPKAQPAPSAPPPDTTSEQLKILKMLEAGTISIEEANSLLAALS